MEIRNADRVLREWEDAAANRNHASDPTGSLKPHRGFREGLMRGRHASQKRGGDSFTIELLLTISDACNS